MEHSRQTMAALGKSRRWRQSWTIRWDDTQMNGQELGEEARMVQASSSIHRQDMEHPMGFSYHLERSAEDLWQHWGQLEGGGKSSPYNGNGTPPQGHSLRAEDTLIPERSTYSSRRIEVNTSGLDMDVVRTAQPRRQVDVTQATAGPPGRTLAAMESLRGPSARCNRGWSNRGREPDTPEVHEPSDIRSPHHAKRWRLGVGRNPGDSTTEGVFAMGKDTEAISRAHDRGNLTIRHGHTMKFEKVHQAACTSTHTTIKTVLFVGYAWQVKLTTAVKQKAAIELPILTK